MVQGLIIFSAVFFTGAMLLLERRCLGKPAVVQPLVLCLITGLLLDEVETCLWLGISLQLLSMGQSHYCNWVLASISAAGGVAVLRMYDLHIGPGATATVALLSSGILVGILFDYWDRRVNLHRSEAEQKGMNIWKTEQGGDEFAALIHRKIFTGFLFGGAQSILGVGIVVGATYLMVVFVGQSDPDVARVVALIVPLFGATVTLGSLSSSAFPFYALIGVAVSAGIGGIM